MFKSIELKSDKGFSLFEIILVIMIMGLMSGIVSQILISATQLYVNHNVRKTSHIDIKRTADMFIHDFRCMTSFNGSQTSSNLDFNRMDLVEESYWFQTRYYYTPVRNGYKFVSNQIRFRTEQDGSFNNEYLLMNSVAMPNTSQFSVTTSGGKQRVSLLLIANTASGPIRIRTTVFPRQQGG